MCRSIILEIILCCLFLLSGCASISCSLNSKSISPIDFGLLEAKTGEERYYVLLRTHQEAVRSGCRVDYSKIKEIDLEIPSDAISIPLNGPVDFKGVIIKVRNKKKNLFLFELTNHSKRISIPAKAIDNADYGTVPDLREGFYIVNISDKNMWVDKRQGYEYGHMRKDIVVVKNGRGTNYPIKPYNNPYSNATCRYVIASESETTISNLIFVRETGSTQITKLFYFEYINNLIVRDIYIETPVGSGLIADAAISVKNCTNVFFSDIKVDGTYSLANKSGYAFYLDNVYNYKAARIRAHGNWGVYCGNNINQAKLKDCDLNRFDIHCYGRDISYEKCSFSSLYNQFSSTYGSLIYESCSFTDFIPYLNEPAYNAYVPLKIEFNDCFFSFTKNKNFLVYVPGINNKTNSRKELSKKYLPDVDIKNCKFVIPEDVVVWDVIRLDKDSSGAKVYHMSEISLSGNSFSRNVEKMRLINRQVNVEQKK